MQQLAWDTDCEGGSTRLGGGVGSRLEEGRTLK